MSLTPKQQKFFLWLQSKIEQDGKAPSLRQAAEAFGVSHNAIAQLLGQLEKRGFIERDGAYSRIIRIIYGNNETLSPQPLPSGREIPVIGEIAAGLPIYAQQQWDGTVLVDTQLFPGNNLFALRIKGESMKDAGIFNQDLVICEPRQYAENGEIVVALVHGEEATVKYFHLLSDSIELRPANQEFSIMRYSFSEIMVQGKVVGVIRDFSEQ